MKNVAIGVALLFLMFIGFGIFGERSPELTYAQKQAKFARQDFDDCFSKAMAMSERERDRSGIANECMKLRDKAEALEREQIAGKK